ncbi:LuxR C-terminal-related transcriptional regulator [Paractinoplanes deccanensis]
MLQRPGLVVLTGPPGCGRTTLLRRLATAGPVHAGGGLAMLQTVPALALSRAVRAKLPTHDIHLLAEAVRSRVRGGLLVIDDLHYVDPATLAALPLLAAHCRVLAALRTPHRLPPATEAALRAAATAWIPVPPLTAAEAHDLARRTAPQLDDTALTAVAERAGGNPLAVTALARNAASESRPAAGARPAGAEIDQVAYAIATALADLPRPARTALAALGLLGRPAPAGLLGAGATDLQAAGLVVPDQDGGLLPVSTYVAETAAGLLDSAARVDLHTRLADLTPPAEAARHLAAAGDLPGAHRRALAAADQAAGGDRAALLLFACELAVPVDPRVRLAAADALLAAGRPAAAARVLSAARGSGGLVISSAAGPAAAQGGAEIGQSDAARVLAAELDFPSRGTQASPASPLALEIDVLLGEALLQAGEPAAARAAVRSVPDAAAAPVVAGRDRVLLLAELATDPPAARDLADKIAARHPAPAPGVAAALAAVQAHFRTPGWDAALAAAATSAADPLISRWSAWLLVERLAADGRLTESAAVALRAARDCAADLAYGWQTRFAAAADWALALHGPATDPATTDPAAALHRPAARPASASAAPTRREGRSATPASAAHPLPGPGQRGVPLWAPSPLSATGSQPPVPETGQPHGTAADSVTPPTGDTPGENPQGLGHLRPGGIYGTTASRGPAQAAADRGAAESAASGRAGAVPPNDDVIAELWDGVDGVLRRAANLTDRALPDEARGYATAATALIEADTGLLAAARAHLDGGPAHPATSWVAQETAWLDGQPDRAVLPGGADDSGLLAGLHAITARWASHDLGADPAAAMPAGLPAAARRTLTAWATGTGFTAAADGWRPVALRERIRCLLAAGLTDTDAARAVDALLTAEKLADAAGLTVLAGRARRGLRRHNVHRDTRSPRSGDQLTRRETDVLRLVAAGEPTRRIAGQLGISAETVDTHIRAGMRKLGARTRTEAAALAFANPARPDTSDTLKDGR